MSPLLVSPAASRQTRRTCARILAGATSCLLLITAMHAADARKVWIEVEEALRQRLPRTAIEKLQPIEQEAIREEAYDRAAKAMLWRFTLESEIEGHQSEPKIRRLESALPQSPAPLQPLLKTVLAHWYWHYFEENRWRHLDRTATRAPSGDDFTTWDLPRLFAHIDGLYQDALKNPTLLQQTPVALYAEFLAPGTLPDTVRPTLFDFLTHEALQFYQSGAQAGARPENDFELEARAPVFDRIEEFAAWNPPSGDSPILRAVRLYQALIRFHLQDSAPIALAEIDFNRLQFARNAAVGDSVTERYEQALEAFVNRWSELEIVSRALHAWAELKYQNDDRAAAHQLAARGTRSHPGSPGAILCKNLIAILESMSSRIETERVWNEPWPKVEVAYQNVSNVWFRILPLELPGDGPPQPGFPHSLNEGERHALLARTPLLTWEATLPPTPDYRERTESLDVPPSISDLDPGFYLLAASHRPDFEATNNQVSVVGFWISDLALVLRSRAGQVEGFLLNARSGSPVDGGEVQGWRPTNRGLVAGARTATDASGFFQLPPQARGGWLVMARHQGQRLASEHPLNSYDRVHPEPRMEQTILFTDRALYRPGQAIHFKGICLVADAPRNNYQVLADREVLVVLRDPNQSEIARLKLRSNAFGSFSGTFNAPVGGLTGSALLQVEEGPAGAAAVHIEEYKRPKFEVQLQPPGDAPRLEDTVELTGQALAYTGAALDQATVQYRVTRLVEFPWYRLGGPFPSRESQEVAHGTVQTGTDGSFRISFVAVPDRSIEETNAPVYSFQIQADVTDSSGETRSAQRVVRIGYTALDLNLEVDAWQTPHSPVSFRIAGRTMDGEPLAAEGRLLIFRTREPSRVERGPLSQSPPSAWGGATGVAAMDPAEPAVVELPFSAGTNGEAVVNATLPAGRYVARAHSQDRLGRAVQEAVPFQVVDPESDRLPFKVPSLFLAERPSVEVGENFVALWGTGYESGRAFVEIEHRHKILRRFWTDPERTQQTIVFPVPEELRGGFTVHVTHVAENRAYLTEHRVNVPWSNKHLDLSWEHLRSKLEPGEEETWTLRIRPGKSTGVEQAGRFAAEMVASLYDASLDQFAPHQWPHEFGVFPQDYSSARSVFANQLQPLSAWWSQWQIQLAQVPVTYRHFPNQLVSSTPGTMVTRGGALAERLSMSFGLGRDVAFAADAAPMLDATEEEKAAPTPPAAPPAATSPPGPRRNLQETAFFFPHLVAEADGTVKLQFTMPESLTEWRFLGFAHDQQLRAGLLEGKTVTALDLMVQPNPPRFLREGDVLEFPVKITNLSPTPQKGQVRLNFFATLDDSPADAALGNDTPALDFEVPPQSSRSFSWKLRVPDRLGFLRYRAVAEAGQLSDGEEGYLPVLSRRIFVTESMPLTMRGAGTRTFRMERLIQSAGSSTLQHQGLTAQMVSNPAWYAVLALPYLMEFPHECVEQVFNRYYANALAQHITLTHPAIQDTFDRWRNTEALDSPLERNQELKALMIEETPWLRQALSESQARKNLAVLFDADRLRREQAKALTRLAETQLDGGGWSWFPGGPLNEYMTLYVVAGFGRLRHLGVDAPVDLALQAVERVDTWMQQRYQEIQRLPKPEEFVPDPRLALYLYGRSFFLKERPLPPTHQAAIDFFLKQAVQHWTAVPHLQAQGHLALALHRWDQEASTVDAILRSLKERSVTDPELGRFWREGEESWWWYRAPLETHALLVEVFAELTNDTGLVEELKTWLLKQKQTQHWATTKATADAAYAILATGPNLLDSTNRVRMEIAGIALPTGAVEPGTGFYRHRFAGPEITSAHGTVLVRNDGEGVVWGSLHWQYLEDLSEVSSQTHTPLRLRKSVFRKRNSASGPVLEEANGHWNVGEELVTRIELQTDRAMEFVHLKDQRGSGTEPVSVLSQYRYQDGLAYYESTRDTATHFFIDYLPRGTYVLEYSSRIQHRGNYPTGIAEIECMYAPEFSSHSGSFLLEVR